jgi:hypothetical protein
MGNRIFIHHRITLALKRVKFLSDRVYYIALRGRWCKIIVLNVHTQSEEQSNDSKCDFYEELEHVFDHFPRYHIKIVLKVFM